MSRVCAGSERYGRPNHCAAGSDFDDVLEQVSVSHVVSVSLQVVFHKINIS